MLSAKWVGVIALLVLLVVLPISLLVGFYVEGYKKLRPIELYTSPQPVKVLRRMPVAV